MGSLSRFIAHIYTLLLVFFTVLFLELVMLFRSVAENIRSPITTNDLPLTTEKYLQMIDEKNPISRYKAIGLESKECSVCLSGLKDGDEIRRLKCTHVFHKTCVDKWIEQDHATCPICRRLVLPEEIVVKYSQRFDIQPERRRREFYGGSDEQLILLLTSLHEDHILIIRGPPLTSSINVIITLRRVAWLVSIDDYKFFLQEDSIVLLHLPSNSTTLFVAKDVGRSSVF